MRTYARGRAYDPNRFGGVTPYHDPNAPEIPEDAVEQARREKGEQAENALAGEELASALPETSPIEEEKETAALESVSEAIDGSEEELSGEEAEEAEQDESGEEPDEDKSKDPGRIRRVLTMLKWIETTGRSEEDAIAAALFQLGMDRDDVSVEVIERAKSGFLGFGGNPAKVRVSYEVPDEEQTAPAVAEETVQEAAAPAAEEQEPAPAPQREDANRLLPGDEVLIAAEEPAPVQGDDGKAEQIRTFLTGLMEHLHVQAVPEITLTPEGSYKVVLQGQGLGAIIGRRGEDSGCHSAADQLLCEPRPV